VNGGLPSRVAEALTAFRVLLGENDALAYLVNMAPRIVQLHRVLRGTGLLYLHCDPTMSHYLKILLDATFGARLFRGDITWIRTTTHNDAKRWSPDSDVLLYYGKSDKVTWNPVYSAHTEAYIASKYRSQDADGRHYMLDNITSPNPRPNLTYEWKGHKPPANGWRYSLETMTELDAKGLIWYPDSKAKRPRLKRYLDE
jgi:site-specific DNA-methyltransferase (adenine-specific)